MTIEKHQLQLQIDNLKTQTKLLEKLFEINQEYENKYGPIRKSEEIHTKTSSTPYQKSAIFLRRSIC